MPDPVKIGLFGFAWIIKRHMNEYRTLFEKGCRNVETTACCDLDASKAEEGAAAVAEFQNRPHCFHGHHRPYRSGLRGRGRQPACPTLRTTLRPCPC